MTTKKGNTKFPKALSHSAHSGSVKLGKDVLLQIYRWMLKSRVLEERLIKIYKTGESYFWIGGPGEEAWGVTLGMLVHKGRGPAYDYLHLHYRCTPTLVAMGMPMLDSIRLMMNRVSDPNTGGRNFSNHYCIPEWNVVPVTSPIEVQYGIALGTAHVQKKMGFAKNQKPSLTVVTGGDAGTAEGDFASCLIWSSRKGQELPLLITVQNNKWGISTPYDGQHGESCIADRARAFQIPATVIDGNDPIECFSVLSENMDAIRRNRQPRFIEAMTSRLYGHSSASGANKVDGEVDCLVQFQTQLLKQNILKKSDHEQWLNDFEAEALQALEIARKEDSPKSESIWDHVFAQNENADWRNF